MDDLVPVQPLKDSGYCKEHFDCTEESKFSFSGCVTYYDNGDSGCHLFCQLERCRADYSSKPQICTFYSCSVKTTTASTTTSSTTDSTTTPYTTTTMAPNHSENPFFWSTLALCIILACLVVFLIGRKIGSCRTRSELTSLRSHLQNLYFRHPNPAFLPSPDENTPLHHGAFIPMTPVSAGNDAWASQNLEAPGGSVGSLDDEFAFFESKLTRPKGFSFPTLDSGKEVFSPLIGHSENLIPSLPPMKKSLEANSCDEYKALLDLAHIQQQLWNTQNDLKDLTTTLAFLRAEENLATTSHRAQRLHAGKKIRSIIWRVSKVTNCEI